MDPTPSMTRRLAAWRLIATLAFAAPLLAACGGGGDESTGDNGHSPLAAATLVAAADELAQRYPGVLPPALIAELRQHTMTEAEASAGATRSFIAGAWNGEVKRNGFVRVVDTQVFNNAPFATVFGNPASVALGSTEFGGGSLLSGSGSAFVINPDNNLRLDNDSLQLFLGYRPGAAARSIFPTASSYLFLTTGEVKDAQGRVVGVGLNIWSGEIAAEPFFRDGSGNVTVRQLAPRYRFYVLEDRSGGPLGLRTDFDTLLISRSPQ
jgi:hypothetical protein